MARSGLQVALTFGAAAALITVGFAINNSVNPPEKGADFLRDQGYTDVAGGDPAIFHSCGDDTFARHYEVTVPNGGGRHGQNVCFGLFGPYMPWFGSHI